MILTKYAIEKIGYKKYPEEDTIEISFGILRVFSIVGINFEKDCAKPISKLISFGDNCTAIVSKSLNDGTKVLTGDVFVEQDESEWIEKKNIHPPFLIVFFKEKVTRLLCGGYRQEKNGDIYLYDGFPDGKPEIRAWEKDILPNIIASLTVSLSTLERPAKLIPVERSIFGTTSEGTTVFDLKMTSGPIELSVSSYQTVEDINSYLQASSIDFLKLESNSTRHLYAAFNEADKLKQFLNYFLFIERFTHSQFKVLSKTYDLTNFVEIPSRLSSSGSTFFQNQLEQSKNLTQRFHWCALFAWKNIDDSDMEIFREIKSLRDRISHGEEYNEETLPVRKTMLLSLKLIGIK